MTKPTEPIDNSVDEPTPDIPVETIVDAVIPITEKSPHQRLRETHRTQYGPQQ